MDASSWRIADPVFAPFARAYPASMVAALTSYWVTHTRILPGFEFALPRACLRERFEDLNGAQHETIQKVTAFLGFPASKTSHHPVKVASHSQHKSAPVPKRTSRLS